MEITKKLKQYTVRILTFYPTYKEWKLVSFFFVSSKLTILFILPIRNGNRFAVHIYICKAILFILPIRNGNNIIQG